MFPNGRVSTCQYVLAYPSQIFLLGSRCKILEEEEAKFWLLQYLLDFACVELTILAGEDHCDFM